MAPSAGAPTNGILLLANAGLARHAGWHHLPEHPPTASSSLPTLDSPGTQDGTICRSTHQRHPPPCQRWTRPARRMAPSAGAPTNGILLLANAGLARHAGWHHLPEHPPTASSSLPTLDSPGTQDGTICRSTHQRHPPPCQRWTRPARRMAPSAGAPTNGILLLANAGLGR